MAVVALVFETNLVWQIVPCQNKNRQFNDYEYKQLYLKSSWRYRNILMGKQN
jgi:hypothetical protein